MADSRPTLLATPQTTITFTRNKALEEARRNVVLAGFGDSKTGKTHFAVRSAGPRYICHLDPNNTMAFEVTKADKQGYPIEDEEGSPLVFVEQFPVIALDNLTEEGAQEYLDRITRFAIWARNEAEKRVERGLSGGTFIVDGMTMLKGYAEKAIVGMSATLGERPSSGGRGVRTVEYAKSNGWLRDFISQFSGAHCDAVFLWEARPVYKDVIGENGRKESRPTGEFKTTMPKSIPFAINAMVELVRVQEDVIDPNTRRKIAFHVSPHLRIVFNSFDKDFDGGLMPIEGQGYADLRSLLLSDLPAEKADLAEQVKASVGKEFVRADDSIIGGGAEAEEDEDKKDDDEDGDD